jgi:hypothetical protein
VPFKFQSDDSTAVLEGRPGAHIVERGIRGGGIEAGWGLWSLAFAVSPAPQ